MSKKYFVEGKGYITISLEEEPIFLSEYQETVEVKPKDRGPKPPSCYDLHSPKRWISSRRGLTWNLQQP